MLQAHDIPFTSDFSSTSTDISLETTISRADADIL